MKVLTDNQYYGQIADIVREQNGTSNTYTPPQMVSALKDLFYEEVEGVPPISFNGIGENLLDYRIDGASGGVGDRTDNLFDGNLVNGYYTNNTLTTLTSENGIYKSLKITLPAGTYTVVYSEAVLIIRYIELNGDYKSMPAGSSTVESYTFTLNNNSTISLGFRNSTNTQWDDSIKIQVVTGSIVPSKYEPYGYKVPVVVRRKAKHTATLQLHDCLPTTMMFDAPEALYYAENGLSAGTYCFTIQNGYDTAYGGGKTYNFTILNDIEAGGQITFGWSYNTQAINSKITTYKSDLTTVIDDNIPVFEGNSGTSLGTTDGNSTNLNHIQRARYGSNNYVQGAIRQFLNSSENAGSVWQPQTKFDRAPDWNSEMSGFLRDLDSNFLAFVGKSRKVVGNNNITDGGGYVTFEDKFFLLSRSEVYGGDESALINEGEPYPYYSNYSDLSTAGTGNDTNRKKNRNGSAQVWGLRTVITSSASHIRTVNTSGGIGNFYANNKGDGVAPACNIELDEDYKYNGRVLNVKDQISVTKGNDILVFDVIGIDVDEEVYFESETTNIYLDEPIDAKANIPSEYTEVEYIESTGTQYINTGFKLNTNCRIVFDYYLSALVSFSPFGSFQNQNSIGFTAYTTGNNSRFGTFATNNLTGNYNQYQIKNRAHFEYSKNGLYQNGSLVYSITTNDAVSNYNCFIFARNANDVATGLGNIRMYYFKIYDNDSLVFDGVPCYRKSDNVAGLYDLVNNVFYTNQGTGNFIVGPIKENESISLSDTNVNIPTIRGTNVLTVDTTVQPSNVYVKSRHESSYETAMRERYEEAQAQLDALESGGE